MHKRNGAPPGGLPPARKRRWLLIAVPVVLFVSVAVTSLSRALRSDDPFPAVAYPLAVLAVAVLLGGAVLGLDSRSRRRLRAFLTDRFPGNFVVVSRSSGEFEDAMEAITGDDPSPGGGRSWQIGFVDRGEAFELWHLDRGKPRQLGRFPWATVTAVSVGRADAYDAWERAVIITVGIDNRHFQVPILPLRQDGLFQRPASDDTFAGVLAHIQAAHAMSA